MLSEDRFFQTDNTMEIWRRYCGFLDLSLTEFMEIQRHLLMEQVKLVANSPLGKALMKGRKPGSVEEFRQLVPLTTYEDYIPYIGKCQEDALVEKPLFWCHTAGRGGNFKWIPYTASAFERISRYAMAGGILASADSKGEVNLRPGARLLLNVASRPYASGSLMFHLANYFTYRPIPPLPQAEAMEFQQRIEAGFALALREGVDFIFSMSSVLAKIAEGFVEEEKKLKFSPSMLHPAVSSRLAWAWLVSRIERRKVLPKDLWHARGIITFGVDTSIYREEIARYWGKTPFEIYGTTEMITSAMQSWNKKGMTFLPDVAFWEFIPERERQRSRENGGHQPATVLLDELKAGEQYEVVYTHFHGMPLVRYRIGDLIRVLSLEDRETGVRQPQITFQARASEVIDLAGLTQLDEKTVWKALEATGVRYEEWTARKEYDHNVGFLRLYIELKEDERGQEREIEQRLDEQLKALDVDYRDLEGWLGLQPVRVTILPPGTFQRYYEERKRAGADLVHLRPPQINPPEVVVQQLFQFARSG